MFLSCIKSQTEESDNDSYFSSKTEQSENDSYFPSLIDELKKDNWHKRRDENFLQVAYDKNIIQTIPSYTLPIHVPNFSCLS